jgi:A/G-specific adenine glycosylase
MSEPFDTAVLRWYARHARDLPWRRPDATPWAVMVSEFMLQQTPVARVAPAWPEWMRRWPTPAALAAEPAGEAVRAWGRLGYPRRALRLHAAATAIVARHGGEVPDDVDALRALPGVGAYTAAAIAAFAFGRRVEVLDTNVRRVYARVFDGDSDAAGTPTTMERETALSRVPLQSAATYSVAVMELGALVCRARAPQCDDCPIAAHCKWLSLGRPAPQVQRPTQSYEGTDRQARGRLLAVLRDSPHPVSAGVLDATWHDPAQRARALDGLIADGLVETVGGTYRLPV